MKTQTIFSKQAFLVLIVVFICFVLSFCKKESEKDINQQEYDTIKPLSYFPVYPGSYWIYKEWHKGNVDTLNIKDTTLSTYILHQYQLMPDSLSNPVYVPFLNGIPIYGYDTITCDLNGMICSLFPVLSEKIGFTFGHYRGDPRYDPFFEETVVIDKKLDQYGDSILILKANFINKWEPASSSKFVDWTTYKKNIGLYFYCRVDTTINDTVSKKWLTEYFIKE